MCQQNVSTISRSKTEGDKPTLSMTALSARMVDRAEGSTVSKGRPEEDKHSLSQSALSGSQSCTNLEEQHSQRVICARPGTTQDVASVTKSKTEVDNPTLSRSNVSQVPRNRTVVSTISKTQDRTVVSASVLGKRWKTINLPITN